MGKGWEDLQEGIVFLQQLLFLLLQLVLTFFWGVRVLGWAWMPSGRVGPSSRDMGPLFLCQICGDMQRRAGEQVSWVVVETV